MNRSTKRASVHTTTDQRRGNARCTAVMTPSSDRATTTTLCGNSLNSFASRYPCPNHLMATWSAMSSWSKTHIMTKQTAASQAAKLTRSWKNGRRGATARGVTIKSRPMEESMDACTFHSMPSQSQMRKVVKKLESTTTSRHIMQRLTFRSIASFLLRRNAASFCGANLMENALESTRPLLLDGTPTLLRNHCSIVCVGRRGC
mmetsp:Transcript_31226/g.79506  ORF Transcript_31226/g.79506 Transcript_31226/m.79506 type:complete len:203 (+) Transcript_31226:255-863(+)